MIINELKKVAKKLGISIAQKRIMLLKDNVLMLTYMANFGDTDGSKVIKESINKNVNFKSLSQEEYIEIEKIVKDSFKKEYARQAQPQSMVNDYIMQLVFPIIRNQDSQIN